MTLVEFLGWVNGGWKTHTKYEGHGFTGWSLGLNKMEKGKTGRALAFIFLSFSAKSTVGPATTHWWHHAFFVTMSFKCRPKWIVPYISFVRYSVIARKKNNAVDTGDQGLWHLKGTQIRREPYYSQGNKWLKSGLQMQPHQMCTVHKQASAVGPPKEITSQVRNIWDKHYFINIGQMIEMEAPFSSQGINPNWNTFRVCQQQSKKNKVKRTNLQNQWRPTSGT